MRQRRLKPAANSKSSPLLGVHTPTLAQALATVLGGGAGLAGLFVAIGFAVEETFRSILGLPVPPLATADYLRAAGTFTMGFGAQLFLLLLTVIPVVLVFSVFSRIFLHIRGNRGEIAASQPVIGFLAKKRFVTATILSVTLSIGLFYFTAFCHYPLYLQQRLAMLPEPSGIATAIPLLSDWIDPKIKREGSNVARLIMNKSDSVEAARRFRLDTFLLLVLGGVFLLRTFMLQREPRGTSRRVWSKTVTTVFAILLVFNAFYWVIGYSAFVRSKNFPRVSVMLRPNSKLPQPSVEEIQTKNWALIFNSEKEIWLFRNRIFYVLSRDDVGRIQYLDVRWIFDP